MSLLLLLDAIVLLARCCYSYVHSSLMRLAQIPLYYTHDVGTLARQCCPCFKLVLPPPPPFNFLQVWEELSKFKFLKLDLEGEIFFFNLCLLMIFLIIHVFGKCWLIMCLFVVCRNYLDIVHLIIHIAFHFYTLHFIFIFAFCNFVIFQHIASFFNFSFNHL